MSDWVVSGFAGGCSSFEVSFSSELQEIIMRAERRNTVFTGRLVVYVDDGLNGAEFGVGEFVEFDGDFFDV